MHIGAVLSVFWMDNGNIYSGGDDYILHCWKPDNCTETNPPPKSLKQDRPTRKKKNTKKFQKKPELEIKAVPEPVNVAIDEMPNAGGDAPSKVTETKDAVFYVIGSSVYFVT